jgi:hypothetical protein
LSCRGVRENRDASVPEKNPERVNNNIINPNLILIILIEGSKVLKNLVKPSLVVKVRFFPL